MPTTSLPPITTDVLVIGGGIAGLRAAISASRKKRVIILNKGLKGESSSQFAQGGIAAALSEEDAEIQSHYEDTIKAGRGLCREKAVKVLVEEGPRRVQELLEWGVSFDKVGDRFVLAREGAHRKSRILRARGDATGTEIVRTLQRTIYSRNNILKLDGQFSVKLLLRKDALGRKHCCGVWALDEVKGRFRCYLAQAVVLATGGMGQAYRRTTNPPVATGDGLAMALDAGAALENMAFFQFHPTALSLAGAPSFLLSEAIRGEGGRLLNPGGERFMARYHPDAELAPRDLVSRAIVHEMRQSRSSSVFLDLSHLDPSFIRQRFPQIYATCMHYGVDLSLGPVPVAPSAHYMMGGIKTDLFGKTTLSGLYAVGEVASTGVHGANRLASNSLLEGLVFGARAGEALAEDHTPDGLVGIHPEAFTQNSNGLNNTKTVQEDAASASRRDLLIQKELKDLMWHDVGIIRSGPSLRRALEKCRQMARSLEALEAPSFSRHAIETRNLLRASCALVESALQQDQNLGAHFREDFPGEGKTGTAFRQNARPWDAFSHPVMPGDRKKAEPV